MTHSLNDEGDCRTAPATPDLLKTLLNILVLIYKQILETYLLNTSLTLTRSNPPPATFATTQSRLICQDTNLCIGCAAYLPRLEKIQSLFNQ